MQKLSSIKVKLSAGYVPSIDGLRAIAVLGVIFYHFKVFEQWVMGGFIGVDVFFVISGFLITRIITDNMKSTGWIKDFYIHRTRRIFPALIFTIGLTVFVSLLVMTPYELRIFGREIFGAGTFTSNFIYLNDSGYFEEDATAKPFLHLWSLAIEEQFYLFWPALIWAASKLKISLTNIITLFMLLSFTFCVFLSYNNPTSGFYSPATRGWELALGGLIAIRKVNLSGRYSTYLRYLGGGLLLAGFAFIDNTVVWPSALSLIPVLGTSCLLIGSLNQQSQSKILTSGPLVYLGRISYPLYLFHWPMYSLYSVSMGSSPDTKSKITMLFSCFLLAHLFYKIVETPVRKNLNFKIMIPALVSTMLVISAIGIAIYNSNGLTFRYPKSSSGSFSQIVSNQFIAARMQDNSCIEKYGNQRVKQYAWWFCRSNSNDPPTVLLWGNSYANQYFEGLASSGNFRNRSILSIGDCSVQRDKGLDKTNPCFGENWLEQRNFVKELILKNSSLSFVVIAGLKENSDAQDLVDLRDALTFLRNQNRKVVMFYPHVKPAQSIFTCLDRPIFRAKWNCEASLDIRRDLNSKFTDSLDLVLREFPETYIFDPNSAFCDEESCKFIKGQNFVIKDSAGHMSIFGSKIVATEFSTWAKVNLPSLVSR
jgi:peptidoglycan/LPS O-acetylase OafA/YrhL